ncbi:uncharacterized protein Z520_08404 [Fonsecaea multimorphosa CBS 102226]|uniref:BZIP domain-containing protein n=1 Tax=Fonsecaea multimorphosa CBS 102226 TaxID=1442371 RepID=A0A0D2JQR5_9EURO|nr:uncharacterized protein Z520_08404 [Fonsecaea multimorphosa CBS 102226]KIX95697.1 hypothetical protein Z520_08404 [Fonsecaea multimorphosa CBS 102226]OAL21653.1 hypothetical protein AYO22_07830 [Fonsecaea multimorphosa]
MEVQPARIVVERRLPTEARREQEDWGGLSDARARRKIQNRLNQRSYRRRRAAERAARRASATRSTQKPVPLAPREAVPAADPKTKVDEPASRRETPCLLLAGHPPSQVDLRSQLVLQQITPPAPRCAVLLANPQVRRVHYYARTTLWPSFKHHSLETNESLTSAFFHLSMVDDLLLNSFVWTAALAMSMHLPHTVVDNEAVMFACQNRAVQSIRERIGRNEVSDSVIFAVLGLTIRDTNPRFAMLEGREDCFGGFDPPLRSLGWIQCFSHFRWTPSHIRAAKSLVAARGGLQHITMPGVAEQIQATDILQASISLCRPHFTLCRLYQHVLDNHVKTVRPPRERLDEAFPAITDVEFKDLLLDMRMHCRELDRIAMESGPAAAGSAGEDGSDSDADLVSSSVAWETNVYRNLIQYRLLRLPGYEQRVEELCRLGAMIFSYGVIFPVAKPKPLRTLAKHLKNALEDYHRHCRLCPSTPTPNDTPTFSGGHKAAEGDTHAHAAVSTNGPSAPLSFLLWLAMLGALASRGNDHEAFFLDRVSTWSAELGVVRFSDLKDPMRSFLWLDRACDKGAFEVWTKIRVGIITGDDGTSLGGAPGVPGSEKIDSNNVDEDLLEGRRRRWQEQQGQKLKDGVDGSLHMLSLICAG